MNIPRLSQGQAAALAGITARRLRQMDAEPNPPPKDRNGQYPCAEFSAWLARTRRKAQTPKIDPVDQAVADMSEHFSQLCGCVLECNESRNAYLAMCQHFGLTKKQALIGYAMQAIGMAVIGEEATGNPDWGAAVPEDGIFSEVCRAVGAGSLDQWIAENWPDEPPTASMRNVKD